MEIKARLWKTPSTGRFMSTISGRVFLHQGEEDALRGLGHEAVFHGGAPHDGGRIDGVPPPGDGGEVEHRVVVRQGVIAGVVAEGAFRPPLPRRHVTFQDDLGFRRHPQGLGDARHHLHRLAPEEPGKEDLIDIFRQGRGGRIGHRGVGPDGHRHRQRLAPGLRHPVVLGPALVGVPVHAGGPGVIDLEAVHAHVALPGLRVVGEDHRQGDEGAAVLGPAGQDRDLGSGPRPRP